MTLDRGLGLRLRCLRNELRVCHWNRSRVGRYRHIIGTEGTPPVEIVPESGMYGDHTRYTAGATDFFCPAWVSEAGAPPRSPTERRPRTGPEAYAHCRASTPSLTLRAPRGSWKSTWHLA